LGQTLWYITPHIYEKTVQNNTEADAVNLLPRVIFELGASEYEAEVVLFSRQQRVEF